MPTDTRIVPTARRTSSTFFHRVRRPQCTEAIRPRMPRSRIPYQIRIQKRRPTITADLARKEPLGGSGLAYSGPDAFTSPAGRAAAGTSAPRPEQLEGVDPGVVPVAPADLESVRSDQPQRFG